MSNNDIRSDKLLQLLRPNKTRIFLRKKQILQNCNQANLAKDDGSMKC